MIVLSALLFDATLPPQFSYKQFTHSVQCSGQKRSERTGQRESGGWTGQFWLSEEWIQAWSITDAIKLPGDLTRWDRRGRRLQTIWRKSASQQNEGIPLQMFGHFEAQQQNQ